MERFAVISDIHGNRWALEAVLHDIDNLGLSHVINLGDVFYGPLDPRGTVDILLKRNLPTVCGNQDRIILEDSEPISDTLNFVREQLQGIHIQWLKTLKRELEVNQAFAFHGSPGDDTGYLLWDVDETGAHLRRAIKVESVVDEIDFPIILCGHDHVPRTMFLPGGKLIVNPGSVGLPAYSDDDPYPHIMETGTPHARYALVTKTKHGWSVSDRAVPYDWKSAANEAIRNCRPDWAEWLTSGQASYSNMEDA